MKPSILHPFVDYRDAYNQALRVHRLKRKLAKMAVVLGVGAFAFVLGVFVCAVPLWMTLTVLPAMAAGVVAFRFLATRH